MKQLEQIGWNHSFVNTRKDGRNIFFFRDGGHTNQKIQYELYSVIKDKIDARIFDRLFIEGWKGEYENDFDSKEDIEKQCSESGELAIHANYLLCGEYLGKNLLWGVEGMEFFEFHRKQEYKKFQLINSKRRKLNSDEIKELKGINEVISFARNKRNFPAVNNTIDYMNRFNLRTAGIIFGDGHFEDMLEMFRDRDIGVVSYFPGKPKISREESLKYVEQVFRD